ncbi:MAG: sulfite exporter TauE/SafE family protein [Gemmatimonadaceae bacterium]
MSLPISALPALPHAVQLLSIIVISLIGGAMNSVAGGGTLLTFPALVGLGISPLIANATSTCALWPASVTSIFGYRAELRGAQKWAFGFAIPSVIGGGFGAWLLLRTPASRFAEIVPWLVLGATGLFIVQPAVARWVARRRVARLGDASHGSPSDEVLTSTLPSVPILLWQTLVGVYTGYFGAGAGILMLAALGFMGMSNIHRMNGLKNWGGLCMNAVAAIMFAFSGLVSWPIAAAMAVGSMSGGYLGSRGAQRVPRGVVRVVVILIGLCGGLWLLLHRTA